MLASIAPRWPRTFTVLGFGYLYIIVLLIVVVWPLQLEEIKRSQLEISKASSNIAESIAILAGKDSLSAEDIEKIESLDQRNERIAALNESLTDRFVVGLFRDGSLSLSDDLRLPALVGSVFFAYILGEVFFSIIEISQKMRGDVHKGAERIARIARTQNVIIFEQWHQAAGVRNIAYGMWGLSLTLAISYFASLFLTDFNIASLFLAVTFFALSYFLNIFCSRSADTFLDALIAEWDKLESGHTSSNRITE